MNLIKKIFKTHKQRKAYKKYIFDHQQNILKAFYEMTNCKDLEWIIKDPDIFWGLWDRALDHDISKYDKEEFEPYRKNYFPINEQEKKDNRKDFLEAWNHHVKANDHHWQHRINWKDEDFDIKTELACLENIMDWLAVGYVFHDRPVEYYEEHKEEITLPKKQKAFMEKCIYQGIDKQYIIKKEGKIDVFWDNI